MNNHQLLQMILREDPYLFLQRAFRDIYPGERFEAAVHLEALAWEMKRVLRGEETRLLINMPPRNLKSFCFSAVFVAWYLGHYPNRRVMCVSYSEELAADLSRLCKRIMECPWYQEVFLGTRLSKRKNTEMQFETTRGGGRLAIAMGGSVTGRGANLIIVDDPVIPENMRSPLERQKVKDIFESTIFSRLDDKQRDAIVVVMQRLHEDDPTGYLLERGGYKHLSFPAIAVEDQLIQVSAHRQVKRRAGDALLPGREGLETLLGIKKTISDYHFASQYQQDPIPEKGQVFQKDWFVSSAAMPGIEDYERVVISIDLANKAGVENDYTAFSIWGILKHRYYLLDVIRVKLEYPDAKLRAITLSKIYPHSTLVIEEAGIGIGLIADLKREINAPVIAFKPKMDKL